MTRLIFAALFFLICGCVNKESIPPGIIQKDAMGKVLWDMIQADQFTKTYLAKDSAKMNVKLERIKLYQEVFNIHHISKDEFQKSYEFYMSRPDLAKTMFDSLTAFANRQRQEVFRPRTIAKPAVKSVGR